MNTKQKGDVGELRVALAAAEKGWVCSKPLSTARYDLVLDDGQRLYRVQVKYVDAEPPKAKGSVYTVFGNGPDAPQSYTRNEIDVVIAYVPKIDKLIWIEPEFFEGKTGLYIRLEKPKNNQTKGIFMAEDHLW